MPMSEKDENRNQGRGFFDINIDAYTAMSQREQIQYVSDLRVAIIRGMVDSDENADGEVAE
jgi:hypothetical protein